MKTVESVALEVFGLIDDDQPEAALRKVQQYFRSVKGAERHPTLLSLRSLCLVRSGETDKALADANTVMQLVDRTRALDQLSLHALSVVFTSTDRHYDYFDLLDKLVAAAPRGSPHHSHYICLAFLSRMGMVSPSLAGAELASDDPYRANLTRVLAIANDLVKCYNASPDFRLHLVLAHYLQFDAAREAGFLKFAGEQWRLMQAAWPADGVPLEQGDAPVAPAPPSASFALGSAGAMSLTLSSRMLQREVAQDKKSTLENLQLLFDILETESRPEGQYGQGMVLDGRPASGRSSESRSPPGDLCLSAEKAALLVGLLDAPSTLTKSVYPVEADRLATLADLKRQAGQLAGAAAIARGLLSGVRPDDWSLHKIYLDCVCGGPAFGSNPGAENGPWEAVDSSIETISQFLEQRTQAPAVPLKADAVDPSRLRGPHLARMEWWLRRQAGPSAPPLAELHGLLLAYFRRFGSRTCFFADVRPYAEAMHRLGSRAEVAALLADLHAECRFDEDFPTAITTAATSTEAAICEPADSLGLIEMQVSYGQMVMLLDPPSAADTAASGALVVALLRKHAAARPAGIGMVVTDLHPGDDLALLASQQLTLMAVALRPRLRQRPSFRPPGSQATGAPGAVSWSGLLQLALAVAESALSHSPYHFRLRLQAIHLCGLLGLPRRAHVGSLRAYSTRSAVPKELGPNTHGRFVDTAADGHERLLQLRQVQNDTLAGHVALDYVAGAGGLSGLAGEAFASVEGVYEAAPLEVSQMVKLAIQKKSFSKVFEFVRFHRRLARSIQQHICTVEAVRGQLLTVSRSGSDHFTLQGGFGWLSSLPTATVQLSDSALYSMRDNRDTRSFADWTLAGNLHADTRVFPLRDVHWVAAYHAAYSVLHAFVPERFADLPALLDQLHQRLNAAVCARSVTWSEAVTLRLVAQLGRFMHQLSLLREADAADNTADLEATAAAIAQSLGSLHAAAAVPTCPADRLAGATLPGAGGMTLDLEQLMDFECASDRHRLSEAAAYAGYLVVSAHALVPSAPVRAGWLERHPAMAAGLAVLNDLQASLLDLVEAVARPGSDADMPAVLAPLESSAAQKALAAGLVAEAERVATSLGLAADISDAMHLPKALANVASAAADAQWSDLAQPCREYLISVHKELFQLEPLFTASR